MIRVHPNIRGLIFDLDGTLADTMGIHIDAWIEAGQKYNVVITPAMINDNAGIPTRPLIALLNKQYGWDIDPEDFELFKDDCYYTIKDSKGKIKPVTEVMNLAKSYHGKLPMAVGTGSIREDALMAIEDMQVADLFMGVVTADDVNQPKPHPETFLKCADIIDIAPEYCQVFEDSPKGVEAALAGGMMVLNILTGELFFP